MITPATGLMNPVYLGYFLTIEIQISDANR